MGGERIFVPQAQIESKMKMKKKKEKKKEKRKEEEEIWKPWVQTPGMFSCCCELKMTNLFKILFHYYLIFVSCREFVDS
jgi:hypothetical protein